MPSLRIWAATVLRLSAQDGLPSSSAAVPVATVMLKLPTVSGPLPLTTLTGATP